MRAKDFFTLIIAFLIFGGTTGGAFVGGIVLGERRSQNETQSQALSQSTIASSRNQSQPQSQTQTQSQSQASRLGQSTTPQGISGGSITGTLEKIDGNIITMNTTRGSVMATFDQDTVIQKSSVGSETDLQTGLQLTIVGLRASDGTIQARSIMLVPETAAANTGNRQPRQTQPPRTAQ